MRLEVATCTAGVDQLQLGVAESHANATLRALTSEHAASKDVLGLHGSMKALEREIERRNEGGGGGLHHHEGVLLAMRMEMERVSKESKAVYAKLHEVELMQVRVIAMTHELKFASNGAKRPTGGGALSGGRAELAEAMLASQSPSCT